MGNSCCAVGCVNRYAKGSGIHFYHFSDVDDATFVSARIRKTCRNYNIRVVFRSGPTFRSMLTKVKDLLPIEKQADVIYEIPCTYGKVYIGEIKSRIETRLKEHKDACVRCQTDKSAITEHAWSEDHPINLSGTKILQCASHTW